MEKIKVDFEQKTLKIVTRMTMKEFMAFVNSVDLSDFTILASSNIVNLSCARNENDTIKLLKSLGTLTNADIAKQLDINERTFYRRLKTLGIN